MKGTRGPGRRESEPGRRESEHQPGRRESEPIRRESTHLRTRRESVQKLKNAVGTIRRQGNSVDAMGGGRPGGGRTSRTSRSILAEAEMSPEFRSSIFCFGGYGGETECLAYVTTAEKWVPLAALPVGKVNATTCPTGLLDRDRSIVIAGGRDVNGRASRSAYKFDCCHLVWKPIAALSIRREGCGSAFSCGHAFVVGGKTPQGWTASVEYFNPIANKWTEVSPMRQSREGAGVAGLGERLYVAGGNQYGNSDLSSVELYDSKKDRWSETAPMQESRWGCGMTAAGGALYSIGGYRTETVERFDPRAGQWQYLEPMEVRRQKVEVALYGNHIYAFGGWIDGSRLTAVERYDIRANTWEMCEPLPHSKAGVAMTTLYGLSK